LLISPLIFILVNSSSCSLPLLQLKLESSESLLLLRVPTEGLLNMGEPAVN
jgi:hypothetical protein